MLKSKKFVFALTFVLMLSLVFVATGCNSSQPEPAPATPEPAATEPATTEPAATEPEPEPSHPEYPTKPIEIIVPFSAGGTSDIGARMIATYATEKLGVAVQVVNKPGAGGAIAQNEIMGSAAPDGYTILLESVMFAAMPMILPDTDIYFDSRVPLGNPLADPVFIIVPEASPIQTVEDLVNLMKEDPQEFRWAATGSTGVATFVMGILMNENGVDINETRMVSFEGSAPSVTAVAGNQISATTGMAADIKAMVDAEKVRPIAVISEQRHPQYPDVPTMSEAGYDGFPKAFTVYYNALSAPPGTPDYIVEIWEDVLKSATEDEAFIKMAEDSGKNVVYWTAEEMKTNMMANHELFKEMIPILGLTP